MFVVIDGSTVCFPAFYPKDVILNGQPVWVIGDNIFLAYYHSSVYDYGKKPSDSPPLNQIPCNHPRPRLAAGQDAELEFIFV